MTFNSFPFKMINETGVYAVNQTIYDMECNLFIFQQKDRYDKIIVHHYFTNQTMKPDAVYNPIPVIQDLSGSNGTMPVVFNRTETNFQYINITLGAALDNIPILNNEMYHKPVKEEGIQKKNENGTIEEVEKEVFIENAEQYGEFTKHPDTVKIFSSETVLVGESTFAEIFVNAAPEKTKYMG